MRLRNVRGASDTVNNCKNTILNFEKYKSKYSKEVFKNNNPIEIEIGMGKGNFIITKALKNPNINYIGIEKYPTVMLKAVKQLNEINIPNLRLLLLDANQINYAFLKEVDKIYLNFSDPWPKTRHEKRRLTSYNFLNMYDSIFKSKKQIEMKTDNRHLFEYSIIEFTKYGYNIDDISLDLYQDNLHDNIPTEYENKFHSLGYPIYKIKVSK